MAQRAGAVEFAHRIDATVHALLAASASTLVHILALEMIDGRIAVRAAALVRSVHVAALVRAPMQDLRALVNVLARLPVHRRQPVARLAGARMRADQIDADVAAVAIVLDALVDVRARSSVARQLVARLAPAHVRAVAIRTAELTSAIVQGALINVRARPHVVVQHKTGRTRAHRRASAECARMRTSAVVRAMACVHRGAGPCVGQQRLARRTGAVHRSGCIVAIVRAVAIVLQALVHVQALLFRVLVQLEASGARAMMRTLFVAAAMTAAAVRHLAFINVATLVGTPWVRLESVQALASEAARLVAAHLSASAIVVRALVHVGAPFAIRVQFPAGRTRTAQIDAIARLRTAAIVDVTRMHKLTGARIVRQSHAQRTRAQCLRSANVRAAAVVARTAAGWSASARLRVQVVTLRAHAAIRALRIDAVHFSIAQIRIRVDCVRTLVHIDARPVVVGQPPTVWTAASECAAGIHTAVRAVVRVRCALVDVVAPS